MLGHRTYEIFEAYWPYQAADNPIAQSLNAARKYVASRTLKTLHWNNSTLLRDDVVAEVAVLKSEAGLDLQIIPHGRVERRAARAQRVRREIFVAARLVDPIHLLRNGLRHVIAAGSLNRVGNGADAAQFFDGGEWLLVDIELESAEEGRRLFSMPNSDQLEILLRRLFASMNTLHRHYGLSGLVNRERTKAILVSLVALRG